jgi:hypothetical protein
LAVCNGSLVPGVPSAYLLRLSPNKTSVPALGVDVPLPQFLKFSVAHQSMSMSLPQWFDAFREMGPIAYLKPLTDVGYGPKSMVVQYYLASSASLAKRFWETESKTGRVAGVSLQTFNPRNLYCTVSNPRSLTKSTYR